MDYNNIFEYVETYLEENAHNVRNLEVYPFRKRSDHIKRVFIWANRLMDDSLKVNKEAVLTAALFHDIGYGYSLEDSEHAQNSAILCEKYLKENAYNDEFIDLVVYLVKNHSNKKLLKDQNTQLELIILIEADLLDETGALSIIWDSMTEGSQATQTFERTFDHIKRYSFETIKQNPMVTNLGVEFWKEKQSLVNDFMRHLAFDLCRSEDISSF